MSQFKKKSSVFSLALVWSLNAKHRIGWKVALIKLICPNISQNEESQMWRHQRSDYIDWLWILSWIRKKIRTKNGDGTGTTEMMKG